MQLRVVEQKLRIGKSKVLPFFLLKECVCHQIRRFFEVSVCNYCMDFFSFLTTRELPKVAAIMPPSPQLFKHITIILYRVSQKKVSPFGGLWNKKYEADFQN